MAQVIHDRTKTTAAFLQAIQQCEESPMELLDRKDLDLQKGVKLRRRDETADGRTRSKSPDSTIQTQEEEATKDKITTNIFLLAT